MMIRRLLQALDPDLLTAAIGDWLAARAATAPPRRAIMVDGKMASPDDLPGPWSLPDRADIDARSPLRLYDFWLYP